MTKYFYEGGPLFMGILSIVLLAVFIVAILAILKKDQPEATVGKLDTVKSLGLFALVFGMLGQFIGLFSAFEVISTGMEISPAMMAGGVKVSMITSIYGMIIFVISYLIWFGAKFLNKN
jgi:hypothetical protein